MRYQYALSMMLAIAGGSATASAAFTGFTVQYAGVNNGSQIYWLFANFNESDDAIVSFNGFQTVDGSMAGVTQFDNSGLPSGAAWDPRHTVSSQQVSSDSFVSVNGVIGSNSVTALSGFGSAVGIANGASWSNSGTLTAVGSSNRVRIAQFAGQFANGNGFLASLQIAYRDSVNSTGSLSGSGTFLIGSAVPGPGALALLALAGFGRSRRR
jgi:hypothetical protein